MCIPYGDAKRSTCTVLIFNENVKTRLRYIMCINKSGDAACPAKPTQGSVKTFFSF